jgi:hypothetical protein
MEKIQRRFAIFCKKCFEKRGAPGGDKCSALSVAPYLMGQVIPLM